MSQINLLSIDVAASPVTTGGSKSGDNQSSVNFDDVIEQVYQQELQNKAGKVSPEDGNITVAKANTLAATTTTSKYDAHILPVPIEGESDEILPSATSPKIAVRAEAILPENKLTTSVAREVLAPEQKIHANAIQADTAQDKAEDAHILPVLEPKISKTIAQEPSLAFNKVKQAIAESSEVRGDKNSLKGAHILPVPIELETDDGSELSTLISEHNQQVVAIKQDTTIDKEATEYITPVPIVAEPDNLNTPVSRVADGKITGEQQMLSSSNNGSGIQGNAKATVSEQSLATERAVVGVENLLEPAKDSVKGSNDNDILAMLSKAEGLIRPQSGSNEHMQPALNDRNIFQHHASDSVNVSQTEKLHHDKVRIEHGNDSLTVKNGQAYIQPVPIEVENVLADDSASKGKDSSEQVMTTPEGRMPTHELATKLDANGGSSQFMVQNATETPVNTIVEDSQSEAMKLNIESNVKLKTHELTGAADKQAAITSGQGNELKTKQVIQQEQVQNNLEQINTEANETIPADELDLRSDTAVQVSRWQPVTAGQSGGATSTLVNEQLVQNIEANNIKATEIRLQNQKSVTALQTETISIYRKDFAEQVKDKVMVMINQKIQQADIQLDPPELGNVHVRVNLQNEQAAVQFVVQNQQAKEALEQNIAKLREMMAETGVDVGDANIEQQANGQEQMESSSQQDHASEDGLMDAQASETVDVSNNLFKASATGVDYYA